MGLRGLAAIQEIQDWQSQSALVPGFVKAGQAPSRRGTIGNHHAAVALPPGGKDSSLNVNRLLASGLRSLLGYQGTAICRITSTAL
jgi:hypothetical protein